MPSGRYRCFPPSQGRGRCSGSADAVQDLGTLPGHGASEALSINANGVIVGSSTRRPRNGPLAAGASVTIGTNGGPYTIPNGTHTITAFVDDVNRFAESNETNNQLSQSITVGGTDTQAPTVVMTAPANGTTVSGSSVAVSANASDNVGVAGVQFRVDGASLGAEDTTSPYSIAWNTTTASNGSHTLTAIARDAAGNTTTSAAVTVTVNNTGPSPPDVIGQWSLVAALPYFPVHTHMLPTGKVMIWPGDGGVSGSYDLFCSGRSWVTVPSS